MERNVRGGLVLFLLGLSVGLPLLAVCALTTIGPPSIETAIFGLAVLTFVVASLMAPWRDTRAFALGAVLVLAATVAYRYFAAAQGETIHASNAPGDGPPRLIDRIFPERDVAIGGTGLLIALDRMPRDRPGLLDSLRDGYARMELSEGATPSAIVSSFVAGQSPSDHSLLRVGEDHFEPRAAVVLFLHGYIGSLTLACWQVAQAANPVGLDVICPATDWRARWAEREGRDTVEETIARLRAGGVRRIYLAGLSAGAIGASRLAASLDIDGLILISGAAHSARAPRVPTIVLQGRLDRMTPRGPARAFARAAHGRYREHPRAGHWMILSHHEWFTDELRRWLAEREGLGAVHD